MARRLLRVAPSPRPMRNAVAIHVGMLASTQRRQVLLRESAQLLGRRIAYGPLDGDLGGAALHRIDAHPAGFHPCLVSLGCELDAVKPHRLSGCEWRRQPYLGKAAVNVLRGHVTTCDRGEQSCHPAHRLWRKVTGGEGDHEPIPSRPLCPRVCC